MRRTGFRAPPSPDTPPPPGTSLWRCLQHFLASLYFFHPRSRSETAGFLLRRSRGECILSCLAAELCGASTWTGQGSSAAWRLLSRTYLGHRPLPPAHIRGISRRGPCAQGLRRRLHVCESPWGVSLPHHGGRAASLLLLRLFLSHVAAAGTALPNAAATSHIWLFRFKLTKIK